jgi:tRNA (guanine26-N2/guanine27-N2)-dimethyltransferase
MTSPVEMGFPTDIIEEGRVKILIPKLKAFVTSPSEYAPSKAPVFYNAVMELNRDVAVLALQAYQRNVNREVSVCEPLAGSGVRGVRFAAEVKGVKNVVMGDINEKAVQLAKHNVQRNGLTDRVVVKHEEANLLLSGYSAPRRRFDSIDVDPFGSPAPYVDSAIRALRNEGLIALTATDMAALCGVHPKACIRKYGGKPLRTEYCHELAVRILTGSLAKEGAKYSIGVDPLFCHSMDHYVRIYATIKYGAKKADDSIKNLGYILHCFQCLHRETAKGLFAVERTEKCRECGSKIDVAGPLWLGKIFDKQFCELVEKETKHMALRQATRIQKMLILATDEADAPITYYVLDKICNKLAIPVPSVRKVVENLTKRGFQASLTHFNNRGIRTNASIDIMKELLLTDPQPGF